ncbi:1,4-dihydroxy-2-naphthoyl-CoA hydrolase [Lewinella marina]|uniref:Phenylacetic acid degradation protein n=1 Tax=Neolewinella marina TaxID=438751 RepID=A0A2G0CJU1_9BACT|nr:hotdog fold thioesterase [Neolewinella marina]NJB84635.1 1,4-dihydroxy-2-naphthoyl-CoA hydrolase [Neolewinella marina]PHL00191.1 phenylacetic acid degradation protein [Neolewinella marina]
MSAIWKTTPTLEGMNALSRDTLGDNLGIRFVEAGDDYLVAEMPVDGRTVQPFRLLHGGASVALAETLGSVAGMLTLADPDQYGVVGVDINATHLRSVWEGDTVRGTVRPVRVGNTVQSWQIDITDGRGRLACSSRLTCQVVKRR